MNTASHRLRDGDSESQKIATLGDQTLWPAPLAEDMGRDPFTITVPDQAA